MDKNLLNASDAKLSTSELLQKYNIEYRNEIYYWNDNDYKSCSEVLYLAQCAANKKIDITKKSEESEKAFQLFSVFVLLITLIMLCGAFIFASLDSGLFGVSTRSPSILKFMLPAYLAGAPFILVIGSLLTAPSSLRIHIIILVLIAITGWFTYTAIFIAKDSSVAAIYLFIAIFPLLFLSFTAFVSAILARQKESNDQDIKGTAAKRLYWLFGLLISPICIIILIISIE